MSSATEFFKAITEGDRDRVTQLLDSDPELARTRDESGASALLTALYAGEPELAELLLARGAPHDVFSATAMGKTGVLRQLLEADSGLISSFSADGWTPLHLAAFFGQAEIVRLLLDHGADVNARSRNTMNNMPLHAALPNGAQAIVELLLAAGADVNARQEGGWVALHEAALIGHVGIVELLLDHRATPDLVNDQGQTPLTIAEEKGHTQVADLLRQKTATA
jgi:ankyrin repeat protein